jgi:hypothetical protein
MDDPGYLGAHAVVRRKIAMTVKLFQNDVRGA